MIDPRAAVHENAQLDPSVEVSPFAVIGPNVKIGKGSIIGPHAVIDGWTTIGEDCHIFSHAAVGTIPQDLKYHGEEATLEIGDRTQIREFTTLNIGTEGGGAKTAVGSDCLLMAYSHVAHDCIVGDNVILANAATLAGHVIVEDHVIVGGLTAIHQFVRIGEHTILGGASAVALDVPPYVTASGNRAKLFGLNLIGLKRRGFDADEIKLLKKAYRKIFNTTEPVKKVIEQLRTQDEYESGPARKLVDFVANSERGVTR